MEKLAEAVGAKTEALGADLGLPTLYAMPTPASGVVDGLPLCARAIALARELGDLAAEYKALWNLMTLNTFSGGDPDEAVEAGERGPPIPRGVARHETKG